MVYSMSCNEKMKRYFFHICKFGIISDGKIYLHNKNNISIDINSIEDINIIKKKTSLLSFFLFKLFNLLLFVFITSLYNLKTALLIISITLVISYYYKLEMNFIKISQNNKTQCIFFGVNMVDIRRAKLFLKKVKEYKELMNNNFSSFFEKE